MRGILARRKVESMRMEEMVFLGIKLKNKPRGDPKTDPIAKMEH